MKILINASNMHTGGGKTMLVDVLNAVKDMKHIIFIVYVDERFDEKSFLANNITFKKCKLYKRIFLINNIQDPIFDWPLNSRELGKYIKNKYGSLATAKTTVHHYEQTIRERVEATNTSEPISKAIIEVDLTTYNTLAAGSRKLVYYYDWEVERNEDKRNIKLIDSKYVASVLAEHAEKF